MNSQKFEAVQACGESFYRAYLNGTVVMTANVKAADEFGFIAVSPIWTNGAKSGSADHNAMVEAIRSRVIAGPIAA